MSKRTKRLLRAARDETSAEVVSLEEVESAHLYGREDTRGNEGGRDHVGLQIRREVESGGEDDGRSN